MVLSVRLNQEYENLFNELKERITDMGSKSLSFKPSNTQIIKAMILYIAKHTDINVDHMEV